MMLIVENEKDKVKEIKNLWNLLIYCRGEQTFVGHMVSVASTQLCGSMKAAIGGK